MRSTISPHQLSVLHREADRVARRTRYRLALPHHDIDDLRQDLLLDLVARFSGFNPERGSLEAFAHVVAGNRASRIAGRVHRDRRLTGRHPVSLDDPVAGDDGAVLGHLIADDQALGTLFGQDVGFENRVLSQASVEAGVKRLEPGDRRLCAALAHATPGQLAAAGHGARATLYRRLKTIHMALLAYGVEPA